MIQIDLEIPKCCDECKFVYDSCKCIITGSRIDWDKSDSERLLDCPLNKIAEPKTGHWILQPSNKEQGERDFVWWKCSECGQVIFSETEKDRREYHAFCGRCGARMECEQNG